MKYIEDLIPWKVTDISLRPFKGFWSMNPSIHRDGDIWRCTLRCADYAMPNGVTLRSDRAREGETRTKNAMVIFDPATWRPIEIYKMREHDEYPRASSESLGYEDIRLFRTDKGGLQGIAASLHLRRDSSSKRKQLAEQVVLSFGDAYDIVNVQPIRGTWSDTAQKNWVPYDHAVEPRFLYSIGLGSMFDDHRSLRGDAARVQPGANVRALRREPSPTARERARERAQDAARERTRADLDRARRGRYTLDASPVDDPKLEALRGGSQLVRVEDDGWLGIGHAMKLVKHRKLYWHVWYLVDARGRLKASSIPMKLVATSGIEFAAGLAIDGDRAVVSFGVDDMESRLGETRVSAVMSILQPIGGA